MKKVKSLVSYILFCLILQCRATSLSNKQHAFDARNPNCKWGRELHGYLKTGAVFYEHFHVNTLARCAQLCATALSSCAAVNWNQFHRNCQLLTTAAPNSGNWLFMDYFIEASSSDVYVDGIMCAHGEVRQPKGFRRKDGIRQSEFCGRGSEPEPNHLSKWNRFRVIGGRDTNANRWPWQVALFRGESSKVKAEKFYAGGVLYMPDIVITAAHNIEEAEDQPIVVVAGADSIAISALDSLANHIEQRSVQRIKIHDFYNAQNSDNDIALLKLDRPIQFNNHRKPACLPHQSNEIPAGSRCMITGYGLSDVKIGTFKRRLLPIALQEAEVKVIEGQKCNDSTVYNGQLTRNMFCAGFLDGSIDACQGDSGGPLVCRSGESSAWILHGIVSWGEGCAMPNHPGVYTKISNYVQWIEATASELSDSTN